MCESLDRTLTNTCDGQACYSLRGPFRAPGAQLSCAHCPASPQAHSPLLALRAGPLGPIARGARRSLRTVSLAAERLASAASRPPRPERLPEGVMLEVKAP